MTAKQSPVRRQVLEHAAGAQLPAYGQCPGCPEGELAEGGVCARHAEPADPDGSLHYMSESLHYVSNEDKL